MSLFVDGVRQPSFSLQFSLSSEAFKPPPRECASFLRAARVRSFFSPATPLGGLRWELFSLLHHQFLFLRSYLPVSVVPSAFWSLPSTDLFSIFFFFLGLAGHCSRLFVSSPSPLRWIEFVFPLLSGHHSFLRSLATFLLRPGPLHLWGPRILAFFSTREIASTWSFWDPAKQYFRFVPPFNVFATIYCRCWHRFFFRRYFLEPLPICFRLPGIGCSPFDCPLFSLDFLPPPPRVYDLQTAGFLKFISFRPSYCFCSSVKVRLFGSLSPVVLFIGSCYVKVWLGCPFS